MPIQVVCRQPLMILVQIEHERKLLFLGDMLELGDFSELEHESVIQFTFAKPFISAFLLENHLVGLKINTRQIFT